MLHKLVYWQPGTRHTSGSITAHWLIFPSIIAHVLLWFSFRCLHKLRTRTSYFLHISVLSLLSACVCNGFSSLFLSELLLLVALALGARSSFFPFSIFLPTFTRFTTVRASEWVRSAVARSFAIFLHYFCPVHTRTHVKNIYDLHA